MTTQTLTGDGVAGLGALPSGLPDEATLARLANEFFSALPGALAVTGAPAARPAPEITLPEAQFERDFTSAPGPQPPAFAGSHTPQASALPLSQPIPAPLISAPLSAPAQFYFLGDGSPVAASSPRGVEALAASENRVLPASFGLPGQGELQQVLAQLAAEGARAPQAPVPAGAQGFYFLDAPVAEAWNGAPEVPVGARPPFDVHAIRRDFPILAERVNGRPLIWFDNAATTQKPQVVIDRLSHFYAHENSNIHRAAHELAARATDAYEHARATVARFLGAASPDEIVFVRGATEAINLVAQSWGRQNIGPGDEIIVSLLEHHANIVPWQLLARETGAVIRVIPVDDSGQLLLDEYQRLLSDRTKLVSVTQVSNALGTVTPVKEIIELAHRVGARVLVDGAQAVSHLRVNVKALDADFYVFSGHKVFGPTGIGAVYGKKDLLESMPPWQGGGNMIADVTFERTVYQGAPARFEAGTGNIADAAGLAAAIEYLERIGLENVARYEHDLLVYATHRLQEVRGLKLVGTARDKASVLSFVLAGYRPDEVGAALNQEGIAVRSGHHCAQPILRRFGHEATVRPSLAFYNTCEEVDTLVAVLHRLARAIG